MFPGCNKLQRKLLFADSLAKLPYKIGAIRGILTNLVNNLKELQFKTKTSKLASADVQPAFSMFNDLQKSTAGLCRSISKQKLMEADTIRWISADEFFFSEVKAACLCLRWSFKRAVIFFRFLSFRFCLHGREL